ncbi:MAG: DNA cytosine methyltransferase [Thiobacillus sp.]
MIDVREIRHFHLFCGLGGGAKGFNKASPRVGNMVGKFRCIGGVDVDAPAIRDFERLTGARGTVLDLFDRSQFQDFHGMEPPAGWREAMPADIRAAAGNENPHIVFLSAPCKGFSGLLSETRSKSGKYQALNRLTVRGVWLMLEAFADNPPDLIVFENVPRIANRGRHLLDQIVDLLRAYGYATAETTHDCGELGGLAQSRKRFLLVARHIEKVPPFLYEPEKKRLQSVGTVLDRMPLPGDAAGGPMHRVPNLQWKTWVRLAFVEAGSDWRSLNKLAVHDGRLKDYLIVPDMHNGALGVHKWDEPTGVVAGASRPGNGAFSIADPRFPAGGEYGQLGVRSWNESTGTVTGQRSPIQGAFSVADPRHAGPAKHSNEFRIVPWDHAAQAVTSAHGTGQCVADPRRAGPSFGKYMVTSWDEASGTVISGSTTGQGAYAVADPRPGLDRGKGDNYLTAGHYGVVPWDSQSGAVSSAAGHDNGRWSVADPRIDGFTHGVKADMPAASDKLSCRILALDGTWHRPFTTLELAALQSLIDPEEYIELEGLSDSDWRERIGNAVPPDAAEAIAGVMGTTLLLAMAGETFMLSSAPIWVQPVAVALSVAQGGAA